MSKGQLEALRNMLAFNLPLVIDKPKADIYIEELDLNVNTFRALMDKGLIVKTDSNDVYSWWKPTELGRALYEQEKDR